MSWWHDLVDWVGGYPYEAARADEIFALFHELGFRLDKLLISDGPGCNQFVFTGPARDPSTGAG
jgi:2-polyprenyl-6-hydroxyphenyl methylase/3-demethylubiquinone-9 3-methyltransferase